MANWADALFNVPPPKIRRKHKFKQLTKYGKCMRCGALGVISVGRNVCELDGMEIVPHLCNKPLPQETICP